MDIFFLEGFGMEVVIVKNLPRTYEKLQCKVEPYRFTLTP